MKAADGSDEMTLTLSTFNLQPLRPKPETAAPLHFSTTADQDGWKTVLKELWGPVLIVVLLAAGWLWVRSRPPSLRR